LNGTFTTAIYSGDGNYLVTGTFGSQVVLFNTTSGSLANSTITIFAPIARFTLLNNNKDIVAVDLFFNVYSGTTNAGGITGNIVF
jgi:hypothetical protein